MDSDDDKKGSDSEEEPQVTEEDVMREVEDKCLKAFKKYEADGDPGVVKSENVRNVLDDMDIKMDDIEMYQIISDIDPQNTGSIQYAPFKQKVIAREIARRVQSDEAELLDAYVAMGGEPDGGGCVDATKLIKTIKEEFQMTIDIEALIEEIDEDGSGEIEFDEFKALLAA